MDAGLYKSSVCRGVIQPPACMCHAQSRCAYPCVAPHLCADQDTGKKPEEDEQVPLLGLQCHDCTIYSYTEIDTLCPAL